MAITVETLRDHYKCTTDTALAQTLSVSLVTIWKWKKRGVPYGRQCVFQKETKGKLKADLKEIDHA